MNVSTFIARRYFFTGRKKNFIHALTIISVAIVAVCTACLVIVLSVFNGLEGLLRSLNSSFDPEIKISATLGKSFMYSDSLRQQINGVTGISLVTEVIEDYVYVKHKDAELVVTMKGLSDSFLKEGRIDNSIVFGEVTFAKNDLQYAMIGQGVYNSLRINPRDEINSLQFHYIKDIKQGSLSASSMYSKRNIMPGAVFSIQKYFDENYIFVPLDFAAELMDYGKKRTSLEIKTDGITSVKKVKSALKEKLGDGFQVLDNEEQHADLYKLLKIEKLFVFIALVLILGVGSINILFVLSMLAIDKKSDMSILYSMGITAEKVRSIFLKEGFIISLMGTAIGLIIGFLVCFLQLQYGFVSMGMETAVQSWYPVEMKFTDFLFIALSVLVITFLVSFRPATIAMRYSSLAHLPS